MDAFGGIGCGNMGGAILAGVAGLKKGKVFGYDPNEKAVAGLAESCGLEGCADEMDLTQKSHYVLIATKPELVEAVVTKIVPALTPGKILISLAAGVSLRALQTFSKGICPVVVIMPNTPAIVGAGCCALCFDDPALTETMKKDMLTLFSAISTTVVLEEPQITRFSALLGSGPAFVFHMLESMVEAGLRLGFSYADAKHLVESLFIGSARLAQANPEIPHALLRMNVCTPNGSSIVGTNSLDRSAVRGALIDAVLATYARAEEMSR